MTNALEVNATAKAKERKLKNEGRKLRDWETENEPYPKKIDRWDIRKLDDEDGS